MVVGLLFLIATIGIGVIVMWSLKNDDVPLGGKTTGLLAIRQTLPPRRRWFARRPAQRPGQADEPS